MIIEYVKDLRAHFDCVMYDQSFEEPVLPLWWRRWVAVREVVGMRWADLICRWRGHDYDTNGCDYVESGGEGFTCTRCGHSFTAWH